MHLQSFVNSRARKFNPSVDVVDVNAKTRDDYAQDIQLIISEIPHQSDGYYVRRIDWRVLNHYRDSTKRATDMRAYFEYNYNFSDNSYSLEELERHLSVVACWRKLEDELHPEDMRVLRELRDNQAHQHTRTRVKKVHEMVRHILAEATI
jgi:hypothetical protein